MSNRVRLCVRASILAGAVVIGCLASTARAELVAYWKFDPTDFYADSSINGHFLNGPGVTSSADTPTGSGLSGSASFDGSHILGVGTSGPIDLSPYSHIRVSWWQKVQGDNTGVLFEHTTNYNNHPGGFVASVNENNVAGTGASGFTTGGGVNYEQYSHEHGTSNDTWEQMTIDYDMNTSTLSDKVVISNGGTPGWDVMTTSTVGSFANSYFHIGGRWGDGETHPEYCYTGLIAGLKIEGMRIPEPGTILLLASGILGLLAYAWRKRK